MEVLNEGDKENGIGSQQEMDQEQVSWKILSNESDLVRIIQTKGKLI